jgi:Gas vesicle synthesis protein GvpL/GvpF
MGIDGEHRLSTETIGDIIAIFSEIALDDFSGAEAQERMEDLAWIGPRAMRHEEVIMAVMAQVPVMPVRFGTIFSSLEAMKEPLRRHREPLSSFFRDTTGKKEWSLRGYVDRPLARSQILTLRLAEGNGQLEGLSPGKRYFLEQKIKGGVEREVTSWLKGLGEDILNIVQGVAFSFRERRLLSREVTGTDGEMFFHGALLLPDRSVDLLRDQTDEWNTHHKAQGLRLELSGPWPPYHFAPVL